jgi:hypothetical protein
MGPLDHSEGTSGGVNLPLPHIHDDAQGPPDAKIDFGLRDRSTLRAGLLFQLVFLGKGRENLLRGGVNYLGEP